MKEELRYKYRIKRKYFQHSAREVADGAIADTVLLAFAGRESFLVYNSFGAEADTRQIIARLLAAGKRVYLPRIEGGEIAAVPYKEGDKLVKNRYGIEEPEGQAFDGDVEVCITPLLAVNGEGYRLGYGGGYYDRYFLSRPKTIKAGIGYALQLCGEKFEGENDVPLDIFISERGIITFER